MPEEIKKHITQFLLALILFVCIGEVYINLGGGFSIVQAFSEHGIENDE